jgi:hypothetical protein
MTTACVVCPQTEAQFDVDLIQIAQCGKFPKLPIHAAFRGAVRPHIPQVSPLLLAEATNCPRVSGPRH